MFLAATKLRQVWIRQKRFRVTLLQSFANSRFPVGHSSESLWLSVINLDWVSGFKGLNWVTVLNAIELLWFSVLRKCIEGCRLPILKFNLGQRVSCLCSTISLKFIALPLFWSQLWLGFLLLLLKGFELPDSRSNNGVIRFPTRKSINCLFMRRRSYFCLTGSS